MNSGNLTALRRLRESTREIAGRSEAGALNFIKWTKPQADFHNLDAPRKLFRSGNQMGKSVAGLACVIWAATGTGGPLYALSRGQSRECWVVCTSWSQSIAIMAKSGPWFRSPN